MKIDLKLLSTQQLLAFRSAILGQVSTSAKTELKAELNELKREKEWRSIVESYDLEWNDHEDYWLRFDTEDRLHWVCHMISKTRKKTGYSQRMKVPQISASHKSNIEIVREFLRERRGTG